MTRTDEQLPPQNLEAEQSVLGACIIDRDALETACDILTPADFYRDAHQRIFDACKAISQTGPVDIVTLSNELRRRKHYDDCGGVPYLATLADIVPTTGNTEHYARIVRGLSLLRNTLTACSKGIGWCYEQTGDPLAVVERIEGEILKISEERAPGLVPIGEVMDAAMSQLEDGNAGVPYPIDGVNRLTGVGMSRGEYSLVMGRTGMGKTRFLLSVARAFCLDAKPVLFYSLEMSKEQLGRAFAAIEAGVSYPEFANCDGITKEERTAAAERVKSWPLHIEDKGRLSISEAFAIARRARKQHGIQLVCCDYAQLFTAPGESDRSRLENVALGFKDIAKSLNIPLLVSSQYTLEPTDTKRPPSKVPPAHSFNSAGLETSAETVLILHRPTVVAEEDDTKTRASWKGKALVMVKKTRYGLSPGSTVCVGFREGIGEFCNLDPWADAPPPTRHYSTDFPKDDDGEPDYGDPFADPE